MVVSADVYRPAAIDQLQALAAEVGANFFPSNIDQKPVDIVNAAIAQATKQFCDVLIIDTAGRLHTKHNLMQDLSKVKRVLARRDAESPHEVLIVLDATTGSNALEQAKQFQAACGLTGAILTKLDGSGRGGTAVALQQELGVPVRFVGTGEKETDFAPFDPKKFASEMF